MRLLNFAFAAASCALLLLTGCVRQPENARIDVAFVPLIPSDTVALAGMRVDKLKKTDFYKAYIEGQKFEQLEEFVKRTELDPRKDLWEFLLATNGKEAVIMARGKFGGFQGLEPNFQRQGIERRNYKGYSLLGDSRMSVLFFNTTVAIAGPVPLLEKIVDNRDNNKEKPPADLLALVDKVPAESQFWAVSKQAGQLLPELPARGEFANFARMISSLGEVVAYADVSKQVDFEASGVYSDATAAKQVHDTLRGVIGMGRLTTPDNQPEMLRFYDGVKVEAVENRVKISFEAPFDLVEKLSKMGPLRRLPFGQRTE